MKAKLNLTEKQIAELLETLKRDCVKPEEVQRLVSVINKSTQKNKRLAEYIEAGGEVAKRVLAWIAKIK